MRKLAVAVLSLFFLAAPAVSLAAFTADGSGLQETAGAAFGSVDSSATLAGFIGEFVIKPVIGLLGLLFFVLMIYAGFLWMTAAGDDKKVGKAKEILRSAIIGAVIILAAYAITDFVFDSLAPVSGV